jgi:UDP-2,3-diacylglucosamine hydrolase
MTLPAGPTLDESRPVLYFVSDVHLGASSPDREGVKRERFGALLDRVEDEGAALFILGDLFDFWFTYRTVIPRTAFALLARLESLARGGLPVRYLGGNHDFWMCDFLRRETAIEVLDDGALLQAQGRRARLFHGDGLGPGDRGYKALKRVLRNPLAIRAFRWIHPDLGIPLGLGSSGVSRGYTGGGEVDVKGLFRWVAVPAFQAGADAVLMGHHHVPIHWKRDEGEFLILGDWFQNYTCVRLQDGGFELLTWPLEARPNS